MAAWIPCLPPPLLPHTAREISQGFNASPSRTNFQDEAKLGRLETSPSLSTTRQIEVGQTGKLSHFSQDEGVEILFVSQTRARATSTCYSVLGPLTRWTLTPDDTKERHARRRIARPSD